MSTGPVLYTGNNVDIYLNNQLYAFVETLTISRSVNRSPKYAVGSPLWVDAPATQATVSVQATNLVPYGSNSALAGTVPGGSLVSEVSADAYPIAVHNGDTGEFEYGVTDAYYNNDAVQIPANDTLAYNCSWIAKDTTQFQL